MNISKNYALKLIREKKAECVGTVVEKLGATTQTSWVINRFDMQRTDHVKHTVLGTWHLPFLGK